MQEGFSDRRKAPRLSIGIKFKYSIIDSDSQDVKIMLSGVTENINLLGMLFENLEQIPINTELKIFLQLPGILTTDVQVKGKVIRLEKLVLGNFAIGVVFFEMSNETRGLINEHIERMDIFKLLEKAIYHLTQLNTFIC